MTTSKRITKLFLPIAALFLLILAINLGWLSGKETEDVTTANLTLIRLGQAEIKAEIVTDSVSRARGLSGRDGLADSSGLLFVFEIPDYYGFWMKEMKFPIDIIWLDENKRVVEIANDVSPETFPEVFYPKQKSVWVLEVPANFAQKSKIKIGDLAQF